MTEDRVFERETVTEQTVEPHETIEKDYVTAPPASSSPCGAPVT